MWAWVNVVWVNVGVGECVDVNTKEDVVWVNVGMGECGMGECGRG